MTIQAHQLTKRYGPVLAVDEVMGLVGLEAVAGRRAGTFSLGMTQRLGVAAALLGDPGVLLLDEPVNGLDPEGVAWIRTLLRRLAGEGRTVFVSSHLMSEMALTADHVIVIGRGRLIADTSVAELVRRGSGGQVRVRSPQQDRLAGLLRANGTAVETGTEGALLVRGTNAAAVGELAARHGIVLHELVAAVTLLVGTVSSVAAFFAGRAILAPKGLQAHLGDPGAVRSVLGAGLYLALLGLLAVGLGTLIRSTTGVAAVVVGLVFILPGIVGALPSSWEKAVTTYLPSDAGQALIGRTKFAPQGLRLLPSWIGFAVVCAYAAAVLVAAASTLSRRDA
jgi:energy-coupling factor transporter ATP-binding protein EcfA2